MLLKIVRKWLKKRLGIVLSIIPQYFVEATKDGTLLAKVLEHYNIINSDELQLIEETRDPAVAFDNYMKYISHWLKRISFDLSEDDIREITYGNGPAAASIFYELYMQLENKEGWVHGVKATNRHFQIEQVIDGKYEDAIFEVNPLCEPLMKEWDVINWEKDHLASLLRKYSRSREEYHEYLEERQIKVATKPIKKQIEVMEIFLSAERTDYTYDELIARQQEVLAMEPFQPNEDEAKRIMKQIKQKSKKRAERTAHRVQLQQELLTEVWKKIAETEEEEFDKIVCEKLLKESQHEKEIAEKLLSIRIQKDAFIQNRKKLDELEKKQRDEEFVRRLFEEEVEERLKFHEQRMALIAEHKRLYEEKLRLKALKHEKVCKDAVQDIADLAVIIGEYKQLYGIEPDKYFMRNWANLFVKQQPIFGLFAPPKELKEARLAAADETQEVEEIYRRELERQDALDEQTFIDYINFENIWMIGEGLDEFVTQMELGMNCLGYAVHRVLVTKYPLPIPEKPNLSQEIEFSVCALLDDLSRVDFLQRLLDCKNIKIIQMEDATNFCIEAYESELKTEFDEPFPEEEEGLKELTPKTKGEKQGKKDKKGKKGKKGKGDKKKEKGSKKGSKKGKGDKGSKKAEKPSEEVITLEDKQAQTPRLFPWERIIFSNKAKLGRMAKQILGQGDALGHKLLVDMFIEYLMSLSDIKGWVLLNYPNNYEQAALLEQALSGELAPKGYYKDILNKESLASVVVEEQSIVESVATEQERSSDENQETSERSGRSSKSKSEKKLSLSESGSVKSSSKGTSGISDITLLDDWNITPEERVMKLLPDLKPLAYSDEENDESPVDKDKTCICICNESRGPVDTQEIHENSEAEQRTPSPKENASEKSNEHITTTDNKEAEEEHQPSNTEELDADDTREDVAYAKSVSATRVMSKQIQGKECVCCEGQDTKEEVVTQKVVTQTDILGLEQDLPAADDQPIERPVAVDIHADKRLSNVVPNPRPLEKEEYNTVLTAYIKVRPKKEEDVEDEDYPIPVYEEFARKEGVEKFYCDQGCYYLLEYEELNSEAIKSLAKTIIGDYTLPPKTSVEIFGEKYKEAFLEIGDHKITKTAKVKGGKKKKDKSKAKKKKGESTESKGKKDKKSKKSKGSDKKSKKSKGTDKKSKDKGKKGKGKKKKEESEEKVVEYEDKEVQFPEVEEEEVVEVYEPRAGESEWEYVNLPIPNSIALSLADLWENFETNYKKSFADFFFNKRMILMDIAPFLAKTRETMHEFISKPDEKGYYLREFQKILNEIDLDLRNDEETKSELLCRIDELREKLLDISDKKILEIEEKRKSFVRQNWLFRQFCEMTQLYIVAFQLEIDRLIDTLQFLSDYYIAVITKSAKEGYTFHKSTLPKPECNEENSEEFNKLFIDIETENRENFEFYKHIEECKNTASDFVESMKPLALKPVTDMKKLFQPRQQEKKPKKSKKAGLKGQLKEFELDEDVKENVDRIFEEWECAINGEFARMKILLDVMKNEAYTRFNDSITWIKNLFEIIFKEISERYENEIASVHKACELLTESVEREVIIQPELTFEGDQLAQIQITLFPDTLAIPDEDYKDGTFDIRQLENIVRILFDLAPSGYIMRDTFLLLIQDILYCDEDNETEADTPKLWRNLSIEHLNILLYKLFDDEVYLYWKDFIVCNLMIPCPTREELMDVRQQFRKNDVGQDERATREEFNAISFWFDNEQNADRLKSMIFKMYETDEDEFNYTAMLLDLCKDKDPILGFVKALELSLGKFICCEEELGKAFVDEILESRLIFEQEKKDHEETVFLAKRTISLLIDKIIARSDEEICIEEVVDSRVSTVSLKERLKSLSVHSSFSSEKIISERKFSHTKIGFECRDGTARCYFLPLELILTIVSTELSWSCKVEDPHVLSFKDQIIQIYQECRNDKFNNVVLAHEFLYCEKFRELLSTTNKFLAHNPVRIVKNILEESYASVEDTEEFPAGFMVPRVSAQSSEFAQSHKEEFCY